MTQDSPVEHSAAAALRVTDRVMMDEHPREDQVLAKLRHRAKEVPPEPAMWPAIVIGLAAGAAMLVARVAKFFP
jgi:hypothetical protein